MMENQKIRAAIDRQTIGVVVGRMIGEGNLWVTEYVITYEGNSAYT
jgi:hypothetical protein